MPESIGGYMPLTESEQQLPHHEIARRSGLFAEVELIPVEGSAELYVSAKDDGRVVQFENVSGTQRMHIYRSEALEELRQMEGADE